MSKQKDELVPLIFSTMRSIRSRADNCHKTDPLSFLHFITLAIVEDKVKPTMKEMAGILLIKSPSPTDIINRLVKAGELKRILDKDDRRLVRLTLTPKGKGVLKRGQKYIANKMKIMLAKLNAKEHDQLCRLLKKITTN
jgi:DNA-binding MarR family transcriptional regulator